MLLNYRLTIAPEFAFGTKGHEAFAIPTLATVLYTVTLKDFERVRENKNSDLTFIH